MKLNIKSSVELVTVGRVPRLQVGFIKIASRSLFSSLLFIFLPHCRRMDKPWARQPWKAQ